MVYGWVHMQLWVLRGHKHRGFCNTIIELHKQHQIIQANVHSSVHLCLVHNLDEISELNSTFFFFRNINNVINIVKMFI